MKASRTFFFMFRGPKQDLLHLTVGDHHVHHCKLLWAATGEWVVDPAWYIKSPVRSYRPWDLALVLEFPGDASHPEDFGKIGHITRFVMEVRTTKWHPDKPELEEAEKFAPEHEPEGVLGVLQRHPLQILGPLYLLRNMSRGASIIAWALRFALRGELFQPFHMINLLKFRQNGGEQAYTLYRDAAGGVVTREGGGLAFMGTAVDPAAPGFDEVMVVRYKSRYQFLHMALLDPAYIPLIFLRDEGLSDGVLHASVPIEIKAKTH